jgi:predicted Zn-dependent protease
MFRRVWKWLAILTFASVVPTQADNPVDPLRNASSGKRPATMSPAESMIAAGHWKRARAIVEPRLREAPDDPEANYLASMIRNAFRDRTSPPVLAEKSVRLAPGVARYHRLLAEVQGVMAQHAGVFQQVSLARRFRHEIGVALQIDSSDVQAQSDLLEFYVLAPGILGGDIKKAEQVSDRIAALDPAEGFLAKARIAESRKDRKRMEAMLRGAADVRPVSYKTQIALAEFYLAGGPQSEAAAEGPARSALDLDSGRVGAWCVLASLYAGRADLSALDALLASAAQAVPDDATPYYRAAERLRCDGRDAARVERYIRIYLAQEPEGNQPSAGEARSGSRLCRAISPK